MPKNKIAISYLVQLFLSDTKTSRAAATHTWYAHYLASFLAFVGEESTESLTPSTVNAWLRERHGHKAASTRNCAARCVVRLFNWAVAERLIDKSPLTGFCKPAPSHRETLLTRRQYADCLRATTGPLHDVIKFLWHTGCRPQEVRAIESQWCAEQKITFPKSQSKGGRRRRVIYLDDIAARIVARLATRWPTGPIFRRNDRQPWTKNALVLAFRRLRERAEIEGLCAYSFRHSFITRMLERGVDVATVAALAGNSPRTILVVYEHVSANEARLLNCLR